MKIIYSNVEPDFRKAVEVEFNHQVEKLDRLFSRYNPDLAELHATVEKTPRRNEFNFSLNLTLPAGTLHATGVGADVWEAQRRPLPKLKRRRKSICKSSAKTTSGRESAAPASLNWAKFPSRINDPPSRSTCRFVMLGVSETSLSCCRAKSRDIVSSCVAAYFVSE